MWFLNSQQIVLITTYNISHNYISGKRLITKINGGHIYLSTDITEKTDLTEY